MVDLEVSYDGDGVCFGGRNILDEYPDKDMISDYRCGRDYPSGSGISVARWLLLRENASGFLQQTNSKKESGG